MSKISREAILHIPKSNYAYGYDKETLHIRLRTKKRGSKKSKTKRRIKSIKTRCIYIR